MAQVSRFWIPNVSTMIRRCLSVYGVRETLRFAKANFTGANPKTVRHWEEAAQAKITELESRGN